MVTPGTLTWFGTGVRPPEDSLPDLPTLPYAVLAEPDEDDSYWSTDGDTLAEGHLQIDCYAGTKGQARSLGDALAAALNDAPLLFAAGVLVYLRQSSRSAALDPDPAPAGAIAGRRRGSSGSCTAPTSPRGNRPCPS